MTELEAEAGAIAAKSDAETVTAPQLQRGLGLVDCILLVVGSMVGSGIFLTTGQIAGALPAPWLILLAWLIGGLMALAGALTYAELGAALPQAGGHYVYLRKAYGPLIGFLDGWLSIIASFPGSIAFVAVGLMAYLPTNLTQGTQSTITNFSGFSVSLGQLLAIALVVLLSAINALGLRAGSGTQNLLTALKLVSLLGITIVGVCCARGHWSNLASPQLLGNNNFSLAGMGAALIGISFAYLGWDASTYMAAEVKQPQRILPRSLLVGTVLVVVVYLLFNMVLLYGLPVQELAKAPNATQTVVIQLLGSGFAGLVGAAILICIIGSLNATIMIGPRISFAMAKDGLMPQVLGRISDHTNVPTVAIWGQALWSCIIILCSSLGRILAFTVLVIWLLSAITGAAVFVLRRRAPNLPRPYRAWGYPWVPGFFCVASLALLVNHLWHTPVDLLWMAGFLLAGLPVYGYLHKHRLIRANEAVASAAGEGVQ
jgi:basic amino acid/polyamine antiporter, APA family